MARIDNRNSDEQYILILIVLFTIKLLKILKAKYFHDW